MLLLGMWLRSSIWGVGPQTCVSRAVSTTKLHLIAPRVGGACSSALFYTEVETAIGLRTVPEQGF